MKEYPSIPRDYNKDIQVFAFDKLDGSAVRFEWSAKRGFYKFGSRTQLIDNNTPIFGEAVKLFLDKYADSLIPIFEKQRWQRNVVCYGEFYGPSSFAGNHKPNEKHDVILFDVSVEDRILEPGNFVECFGHLDIPKLVHRGKINEEFIKAVHNSQVDGITFEGVVAKGPWNKKRDMPTMFKIKTNAWIEKLKTYCNGNKELMARLL